MDDFNLDDERYDDLEDISMDLDALFRSTGKRYAYNITTSDTWVVYYTEGGSRTDVLPELSSEEQARAAIVMLSLAVEAAVRKLKGWGQPSAKKLLDPDTFSNLDGTID